MARPLKYKTDEERAAYQASRKKDRHKVSERHTEKRTGDRHRDGYVQPKRLDKFAHSPFVAWDGEGLDIVRPDGEVQNIYALLMNSMGDIAPTPDKPRPYGIGTVECLELLLKGAHAHPGAIHVIFSGNYDINKILVDVPRSVLTRLLDGKFMTWTVSPTLAYGMRWHPRREFFVGRFVADKSQRWKETGRLKPDGKPEREPVFSDKITLWDCWGFWQGSFLRALRENFCPSELKELEYDTIAAGKAHRSDFTLNELHSTIIPYCRLEVRALVMLMEKLRRDIEAMKERLGIDIKLRRWDGSGSLASSFMNKFGLRKVIEAARLNTPPAVEQAGLHAYGGGRFESPKYGHFDGSVWAYDINSAFPSIQVDMPDLSAGEWKHHINQGPHIFTERRAFTIADPPDLFKHAQPFSLFKVSWRFSDHKQPFYPFFSRGDDLEIDYPAAGLNWVWYPEVLAAAETLPNFWNWVHIHEAWEFVPETGARPFAFLADLYTWRRMMKDEGNGGAQPLKFGVNGTYGKLAQKLGYDPETGRIPTYHNILYAGYTTAGTRAKVWRAIMQEPKLIVDIATDGIKSLGPLNLKIGGELGEWSHTRLSGLTLVQSGVYWTHEKSETPVVDDDGNPDPCWLHGKYCAQGRHARGFDPEELREQLVLESWKHGERELAVPARRFVTLGTCISPTGGDGELVWDDETIEDRWDAWGKWNEDPRTLKLMARGSKRIERRLDKEGYPVWGKKNPSATLVDTYARSNPLLKPIEDYAGVFPYPDTVLSRKHDLEWDDNPMGKPKLSESQKLAYEEQEAIDREYQESLE